MDVSKRLSFSLDHRDQGPNKKLAKDIVDSQDKELLEELIQLLESRPAAGLQKDCAVTLAYVAEQSPRMLTPYTTQMINNMDASVNRVIWGSMMVLAHIAPLVSQELYSELPKIMDAMDKGTVVTRDYGFRILVELYQVDEIKEDMLYIILEQLAKSPGNQLGQYAERFMPVVTVDHKPTFIKTLEERRGDLTNEHHLKRLTKNLKKLYK
ncbi:MAG: hypothetical protein RIM99_06580 [Cyclobacteriaceae bacterium]